MSPSKSSKGKGKPEKPAGETSAVAGREVTPPPTTTPKRWAKTPATPPKLDKKAGKAKGQGKPVVPKTKVLRLQKEKLGQTPRETREKVREMRRKLAIGKALKTQKKVLKSHDDGGKKRVRKARTSIRFHRPRTFRPPRNPKFPKKSVPKRNRLEIFNIILYPVVSETAMKKIENENTMVFICNPKATKIHIRAAIKKLLDVNVARVNTLICPNGKKKAYVKLGADHDALDQASKMHII